ncbi:hypothetical protein H310_11657 [Aphanomyces invadans]|uniref:Anaphase-promoting complex subunit 4 WD40 domain-containing protein n=1 Tax=Aphanomyces invadans TaxID=157072 RepID=A0A024TM13_9STRA|nr:hypothetical protein H310_11657 [Aphanomyces invadans]ETV94671.1 hypothetical protein H310_11657 [Aphanomyces invadans]|eukprot:XP_008876616.1 hypothetical protein H310_11657 [Aphanomyces invadans]
MSYAPPPPPTAATSSGHGTGKTNVSELLAHSQGIMSWSGCGRYLAVAKDTRLCVRDVTMNLSIVQLYTCVDMISAIQWAPHDEHDTESMRLIFCAMFKRAIVQVFSILDPTWHCKIAEGICGLVAAKWTPDTRHIITVSDFRIHATVWSLVDTTKYVIRHPKLGAEGMTFSPDGTYLAVAERSECKDAIGIYNVESWELVRHFDCASYDMVELSWSMDGRAIVVRDTFLEYRVLFYSIDGDLLHQFEAYQHALGIKSMVWSPSGQFLAVGSFDEKIRLLSHMHWKCIAELDHPTFIPSSTSGSNADIYKQDKRSNDWALEGPPHTVTYVSPDPLKEVPKVGVGVLAWSHDAGYLATKNDAMPYHIWIWKTDTMALHTLLVSSSPIKTFRWNPVKSSLALGCGNSRLSFWTPNGLTWMDLPDVKILGLRWHPKGDFVVVLGKTDFCVVNV